jgi:hypothetical protein
MKEYITLLSTAYFGPVQYYSKIASSNKILIEKHENYTKQTYRNRCKIYSANGELTLSFPVKKGPGPKTPITGIRLDYDIPWTRVHFKAIESAYRNTPFYDFYIDDIQPFFEKRYRFLFDFNNEILFKLVDLLEIDASIGFTEKFIDPGTPGYMDYRYSIHPKPQKNLPDKKFKPVEYLQAFAPKFGFIPNLSILDLLFNEGPGCMEVLKKNNPISPGE